MKIQYSFYLHLQSCVNLIAEFMVIQLIGHCSSGEVGTREDFWKWEWLYRAEKPDFVRFYENRLKSWCPVAVREHKAALYYLFHMFLLIFCLLSFALLPQAASFAQLFLSVVDRISAVEWTRLRILRKWSKVTMWTLWRLQIKLLFFPLCVQWWHSQIFTGFKM